MNNSPRHNVGSVADPHWVVDEEHYLKAVADSDHFFACWQDTLEQRDKLAVVLKTIRRCLVEGAVTLSEKTMAAKIAIQIDNLMQECGK